MWIFENHNIISEKLKVTGCKTQWICGFSWSLKYRCISSAKWCGFVDFWKSENEDSKSQSNCTQKALDVWIFIMDISMACLRLVTLIAQIDVDLWIFHIHIIISIKLKVTGRKTQWISGFLWSLKCRWISSAKWCGFVDFWKLLKNSKWLETKLSGFVDFNDLWCANALAQNDVDLWIF